MFNRITKFVNKIPTTAYIIAAITAVILAVGVKNKASPEKSIVAILNKAQTGGGKGFAAKTLTGKTVIVSNEHVCKGAEKGFVRVKTDSGRIFLRKVLAENAPGDLCIIEGVNIPALTIVNSSPNRFEEITVLGHPYMTPTIYSKGQYSHDEIVQVSTVSSDGTCPEGTESKNVLFFTLCIQEIEASMTTIVTYPGNSGSPVLNSDGHVVGVINIADRRMNHGGFIQLEYLLEMLNAL